MKECPLRNSECHSLKYLRDELFCNKENKLIREMHHNDCSGDDILSNTKLCPGCGRLVDLISYFCGVCGWDFRGMG